MTEGSNSRLRSLRIAVVGSINIDLVVECQRLPRPGETIHGDSIRELPGGKGANQAVAAARLGADVSMIGRVGDDLFAPRLIENLSNERVAVDHVQSTSACASGVAIVSVEASGENAITIVSGANGRLSPEDVRRAAGAIEAADLLMLQLEVPLETIGEAITTARACRTLVLLDPAPAPDAFPHELMDVDYICPNETEAAVITGLPTETDDQVRSAAHRLCELGARCAVITRGDRGALVCDGSGAHEFIEGLVVRAVDTTGAGDAFAAAFAVRVGGGDDPFTAARYACIAGARAASRIGAQNAMPTRQEIDAIHTSDS